MTWGLAWAGLAVVVAVPSLDFVTGNAGGQSAAVVTSTTEPVIPAENAPAAPIKTAAVTTKVTPSGITITPTGASASGDPVQAYLKTNSSLPDYISDGASASSEPKPVAPGPTQVATIDPTPAAVAPVPFPTRPPDVATPRKSETVTYTASTTTTNLPAAAATRTQESAPKLYAPSGSEDDIVPPTQEAAIVPPGPVPPATIDDGSADPRGGRLQRYLSHNGLLSDDDGRSTASVTVVNRPDADYDPDGFYLSDGPNEYRAHRRARVMRMLEEDDQDDGWMPNFSLF